jgi:hypothetical protein
LVTSPGYMMPVLLFGISGVESITDVAFEAGSHEDIVYPVSWVLGHLLGVPHDRNCHVLYCAMERFTS